MSQSLQELRSPRVIFITGTDTDVGKTSVSCRLLETLIKQNHSAEGIKLLAAGRCAACTDQNSDHNLIQSSKQSCFCDATRLALAAGAKPQPALLSLIQACSPNIAAQLSGVQISSAQLIEATRERIAHTKTSYVVLEGAGGWHVPINDHQCLSRVAVELDYPVVLVVGIRLGCLNHALLSEQAILSSGVRLIGWIANEPAPAAHFKEQLDTLKAHMNTPCVGVLRYQQADALYWPSDA